MENQIKSISLELTNRCNLLCKHCSTNASPNGEIFLDLNTVKKLLQESKKHGAKYLSLSGGEPLLHPQIAEILKYADNLNYKIDLYTSGIVDQIKLEDSKLMDSLKEYVDTLIFSLYSDSKKIHDYITNVKGSFKRTLQAIKIAKLVGISTEVHVVPMSVNYKKIPNIIKLLKSYDINRISLLRLVPQGRCLDNIDLMMNKNQSLELRKIVKDYEEDNKITNIRKGAPYKCLFFDEASHCSAGKDKLLISPNGDVHPCESFKSGKSESNIKEKSLIEIWQKDTMLNEIRTIDYDKISSCRNCQQLSKCLGGCPGQRWLKYDDFNIGPDPACVI